MQKLGMNISALLSLQPQYFLLALQDSDFKMQIKVLRKSLKKLTPEQTHRFLSDSFSKMVILKVLEEKLINQLKSNYFQYFYKQGELFDALQKIGLSHFLRAIKVFSNKKVLNKNIKKQYEEKLQSKSMDIIINFIKNRQLTFKFFISELLKEENYTQIISKLDQLILKNWRITKRNASLQELPSLIPFEEFNGQPVRYSRWSLEIYDSDTIERMAQHSMSFIQ